MSSPMMMDWTRFAQKMHCKVADIYLHTANIAKLQIYLHTATIEKLQIYLHTANIAKLQIYLHTANIAKLHTHIYILLTAFTASDVNAQSIQLGLTILKGDGNQGTKRNLLRCKVTGEHVGQGLTSAQSPSLNEMCAK